ncbi:hypothetical protein BS17DRAFT_805664 [Gyrodon lividus]|nr:hypothetical protein BS17DRAFT_805664 [Gyrodon lividus]
MENHNNLKKRQSEVERIRNALEIVRDEDQAVDIVSSKVYDEMDHVKDVLRGIISSITPESLMTWDINSTMDRIVDKSAPTPQASSWECVPNRSCEAGEHKEDIYYSITSQPLLGSAIHDHTLDQWCITADDRNPRKVWALHIFQLAHHALEDTGFNDGITLQ